MAVLDRSVVLFCCIFWLYMPLCAQCTVLSEPLWGSYVLCRYFWCGTATRVHVCMYGAFPSLIPHSSPPWFTSIGSSLVHVSSGLCWEGGEGAFTPLCQNYAPSLDLRALCEVWKQDNDTSPNLLITVNFWLSLDKFPKWPLIMSYCIVYCVHL